MTWLNQTFPPDIKFWADCIRDIETVSEHGSMKYDDLVEVFKSNKTIKKGNLNILYYSRFRQTV